MSNLREPSCIGCYPGDPDDLRDFFEAMFAQPRASGLPSPAPPDGSLVAALLPHIDYGRGFLTYTWGFKELIEKSDASLFVIVGTSHYSHERFTLTREDFLTPLGVVPTDRGYIDRLEKLYGSGLFDDPLAHVPEHSIELEVVLLHYLLANRRPFRIVPLVVGSFHDALRLGQPPSMRRDIGRMVCSLRTLHEESKESICYLISGDLAHIGPKFQDPWLVDERILNHSRQQDLALMAHAEAIDILGYAELIRVEGDRRRICGFPPTWTVLDAIQPSRGRLLHYGCYVEPDGHESVSFASMGFYR